VPGYSELRSDDLYQKTITLRIQFQLKFANEIEDVSCRHELDVLDSQKRHHDSALIRDREQTVHAEFMDEATDSDGFSDQYNCGHFQTCFVLSIWDCDLGLILALLCRSINQKLWLTAPWSSEVHRHFFLKRV
jgi:hypothetical protein